MVSVERVRRAAADLGLPIELRRMAGSTRTADDAAKECGCTAGQIVKSLIFMGKSSRSLYLFLVSGVNQLDLAKAADLVGEAVERADPREIRSRTGFAIGGVAPVGSLDPPAAVFIDETLMAHAMVWAAAGAPDTVFACAPRQLAAAIGAVVTAIAA